MTAEDVDLNKSIAFEKLALSPQQHKLNDLNDHEQIIITAIKEIRAKKKRPDHNSIFNHVTNKMASNIDKKFVESLIDKLKTIVKTPNKKAKSLVNSNTATPNCDIVTETPVIKENCVSKLIHNASKNVQTSPETVNVIY